MSDDMRYIRQTILDKIGDVGQQKMSQSAVAIIGCGGLGSIAAPYLAGAGIGKIVLIDGDAPHVSNLHRQVLFNAEDSTTSKAELLKRHILQLNPTIKVEAVPIMLNKDNIAKKLHQIDVVMECTDDIHTKYLVNDYCNINELPMVYGAIHKYDGYVSFFDNKNNDSIHLRDIFPEANEDLPTCSEVGVMGPVAGLVGILQANEVIKYLTKAGPNLIGKLLSYDILENRQLILTLKKNYTNSIFDLYRKSTYLSASVCDVTSIDWETLFANRNNYDLVSILNDKEHIAIDDNVFRQSPSEINIYDWEPMTDKPVVYYCTLGKRSAILVSRIKEEWPDANVMSLAGGLKSMNK